MNERRVIALGFFDGVHIGHGALLKKTCERATELGAIPAAMSFDTHPDTLVFGTPTELLNTMDERKHLMQSLYGIEDVIFCHFDRDMMNMPWEAFVEDYLVKELHACHLVCGHDYRFGARGLGDAQKLAEKCRALGLGCDVIGEVKLDGITVSSTYIRQLVESGDVERAAHFLGHRHCMTQTVGHGQRIGRTIGIPTVNLAVPGHVLVPKHGVYVSRVYLPGGKSYAGVTNVGTRPTVSDSCTVSVETFLLDFQGDLYGQRLRLEYCRRLRDEEKFGSLEQLRDMIRKNIEQTRAYFRESCIE